MSNILKVDGKIKIGAAILSIIIPLAVGGLSAYLGMSNVKDYETFIKPAFSPPGWVFPIVWTILYILMGLAAYRIWGHGKNGEDTKKALVLYGIQLFLNFLWTIIFFRFRLYGLAFVELLVLLVFIMLTTFEFFKIDKIAGYLMIPYILWVSFAGVLNFAIWYLNS
jgi:benzodiazapine receptor